MKRRRFPERILLFSMVLLAPGCATLAEPTIPPQPRFCPIVPATIFVANGAGDFQITSKMLGGVLASDGYPIEVITCEWSHGKRRIVADQVDYPHARREGIKLAALVLSYHETHPERPIYLLAHSAGALVVLVALEHLPCGVVERAILLAPSLSSHYDIRPALRSVKHSIHVFHSDRDNFYLGTVMHLLGTSDRHRCAAAGAVGFQPCFAPDEADLASKLVQRPWQPADRALGNNGGHFSTYQPDFMRMHIFPLFSPVGAAQ